MVQAQETKRLLYYSDLFIANFWRCLLRSLWLFFPPILFLALAYLVFWHLPQGKDLIVISLQNAKLSPAIFPCFILALIFWVYVTWYSTRIVARAKHFEEPDENSLAAVFRVQSPRILAFTCITVIFLALFQLDNPAYSRWQIGSTWCHVLFLLSFSWYFLIWRSWTWYLKKKSRQKSDWLKFLLRFRLITYSVLIAAILSVMIVRNFWGLVVFLVILQMGLVLLLILRRDITEARGETVNYYSPKRNDPSITTGSPLFRKMRHIIVNDDDDRYFIGFNIISLLAASVYFSAIVSVNVSVMIGSFPFILLAFGVLLGIGNFITLVSVFARFNFHLVVFVSAMLIGNFVDPHRAAVSKKENETAYFRSRQNLREYFLNWLNDSRRKKEIESMDSSRTRYPVYFVMANGGASRSGYWTASILANLEDKTREHFSEHLFCLSGASGGSVGTATFFSLLKARQELKHRQDTTFATATARFLESDFLTYTLAHLLGPDIFRNIIPLGPVDDRASALALAMEEASGENSFMYRRFADKFSSFMTQKGQANYPLPVICINTTRMQDSHPGVISNINIKEDSALFNNRIDVLSLLREQEDMKLSTAVVLGASFPYISPAGRINSQFINESGAHYFVDGGYFDNSGAGVVNEMLIAMNNLLNNKHDSAFLPFRNKIEFYVIHISNTEPKKRNFSPVNPIANDLLAPVRTLMGSYGTQTTINDQRLKNYLTDWYGNDSHYTNIDLYRNGQKIRYTMNWVISRSQLDSMKSNLLHNDDVRRVYTKMDSLFRLHTSTEK
jgi:predicted acylesterase/phospholipase RssA